MKNKIEQKPHNCKTCTENIKGYCKLRLNGKLSEYAKCENIKECGFYRIKR